MLAALGFAVFLQAETRTVELYDGAMVSIRAGQETLAYKYWSCADTFLDARSAEQNFGGSHILQGGPSRTVLLKFGDLNRAVNGYRKVRSAKIVLTPISSDTPGLKSVSRMLAPWGEGPLSTITSGIELKAPRWSANWRERRAGPDGIGWQSAGATGPSDATPIEDASLTVSGEQLEIGGLESAVQDMIDRWHANHGFALNFESAVDLQSSEAANSRPKLVLELERAPAASGPDLSVSIIEMNPEQGALKEGASVKYAVRVRNVGSAPAKQFEATWVIKERVGSTFVVPKELAPGEETTIELSRTFRAPRDDHRLSPVGLLIKPSGPDAVAGNDYLEVSEAAIPIAVSLESSAALPNSIGSASAVDAMQEFLRVMNDHVLAESRFSFALDGALARLRLQSVGAEHADVRLNQAAMTQLGAGWSPNVASRTLNAKGVPLLNGMQIEPMGIDGKPKGVLLRHDGKVVSRGAMDRYPGLLWGGSTLDESRVPVGFPAPYEPVWNPMYESLTIEPRGLLAASTVAFLNGQVKSRDGMKEMPMPGTTLVRAMTFDGRPLSSVELKFYQSQSNGGQGTVIPDSPAVFVTKTSTQGTALAPTRAGGSNGRGSVYGDLDADGSNGVYLVSATANDTTEWAWMKAWQIADAFARTGRPAVIMELRFNLPSVPIDFGSNVALNRVAQDSGSTPPVELAALLDGKADSQANLPNRRGAWLEIDLARDRPVAEVSLVTTSLEFWQKFDVLTYSTGETAEDAQVWAREVDWRWSARNRRDIEAPGAATMRYRGASRRARYIRIVCREAGPAAKLAEIRVLPAKPQQPN